MTADALANVSSVFVGTLLVELAENINGIAPEVSASQEGKDIDVAILFEGPHVTVFGSPCKTGLTADGRLEAEQEPVVVCVTYVLSPSFEEEIFLGNDLPELIVGERITKHEGKVPAGSYSARAHRDLKHS